MDCSNDILFALAHFAGAKTQQDDGSSDPWFATLVWTFWEQPAHEILGKTYSPGLPGHSIDVRASRELSLAALATCSKSLARKLMRITCCVCSGTFALGQFHRSFRWQPSCLPVFRCRVTGLFYHVARGSGPPQVDHSRGTLLHHVPRFVVWGSQSSFGGPSSDGPQEWSTTTLYSPEVGCNGCGDLFTEHPQCASCRYGGVEQIRRRFVSSGYFSEEHLRQRWSCCFRNELA